MGNLLFTADVIEGSSIAVKNDVGSALKTVTSTAGESPRSRAMQKWITKAILESVSLYGKEGRVLLQSFQASWLDIWATDAGERATNFEDYVSQRVRNFGLPYVHTFVTSYS